MKIKIESVNGISYPQQCRIIADNIEQNNMAGEPNPTKKGFGIKIYSGHRNYHVSCLRTNAMWVFTIWWAV